MQEYIKQREKEFNDWANNVIEHESETKWAKNFQKQTIIGLLEQECERLKDLELTYEPNLSYNDPDFKITQRVYEQCLQDQINYYQQQIKELTSSTGQ